MRTGAMGDLHAGWDLLIGQARIIAMLPIEDWLEGIRKAEAIAPITDPTLFRAYSASGKGEILTKVFVAALALKREIIAAQEQLKGETL